MAVYQANRHRGLALLVRSYRPVFFQAHLGGIKPIKNPDKQVCRGWFQRLNASG
jgi:hypothetical protein